jgi:hypothetical protein
LISHLNKLLKAHSDTSGKLLKVQEEFDLFKEQSKKKSEESLSYEKEKQEITEKTI